MLGLLQNATVHCCPSLPAQREAFGLVNIEAKQAGLPTVCFRVGALPELIEHRVNGWVCAEVSAPALAEGLDFILSDTERAREMGEAARISAQRFDRAGFAAAWNDVFASPRASSGVPCQHR